MSEKPRKYGRSRPIRSYENPDEPLKYIPMNLYAVPRDKEVRAIMQEGGFETWRDIFVDWDTVNNLENYRRNSANKPGELVKRYEIAVTLGLVRILYDYINDMYNVYIMDSQLKG